MSDVHDDITGLPERQAPEVQQGGDPGAGGEAYYEGTVATGGVVEGGEAGVADREAMRQRLEEGRAGTQAAGIV